jgi:acyl-CoA dehydrogenase family member 9
LKGLRDDMLGGRWSLRKIGQSIGVLGKLTAPWLTTGTPEVPVQSPDLLDDAHTLGKLVRDFGLKLPHVFMGLKDEATFAQAQLVHERIADIAIDLYVSACVLSRLDYLLTKAANNGKATATDPFADVTSGKYFLNLAFRRIRDRFAALDDNDDGACLESARSMLGRV